MHVSSSIGNFFNKNDKALPASDPINGGQVKPSIRPESAMSEAKISARSVEVKPVEKIESVVSNQMANPASEGVDITA